MDKLINIIGDMHNCYSLKNILDKFDNIILLGDIGAALEKYEFFANIEEYRNAWKAFAKQDFSMINQDAKKWFKEVNIKGWKKQLDQIIQSKKRLMLNFGNADLAMISFFSECAESIKNLGHEPGFEIIKEPSLRTFDNIQIIFLPYQEDVFKIKNLLENIDLNKQLFVLAHCPAFKESRKKYYMNHYNALLEISKKYLKKFYFIHGHMHPSKSYKYQLEGLPNIVMLTPKADESSEGININHDIIQINPEDSSIILFDNTKNKPIEFEELPKEFYKKENHWNKFEE